MSHADIVSPQFMVREETHWQRLVADFPFPVLTAATTIYKGWLASI
jgi:uncharacterized protein (DUF1697 family)